MVPSNHLILCHPPLLLPSIFPSIRVFSNESVLRIRWPKYWSFSFNISPSNEHVGSIATSKDSGSDGIPVELFQILKDDAVKVLHQYASKFGKLSSCHRTRKGQFSFQSQRKAMPKNAETTTHLHSSHTLVK